LAISDGLNLGVREDQLREMAQGLSGRDEPGEEFLAAFRDRPGLSLIETEGSRREAAKIRQTAPA
jgi:hypothetical protein